MAAPVTITKKRSSTDWALPAAAVAMVFVMLIPLPAILLDLLLALSITCSVLVLLSAIYILKPVQFSVFPSLLLLLTLFRLSLNMASSRRILLHGNEGAEAAGSVIGAFGQFVVGGNYVVGFVIFLALVAIQYLVVAHGSVRTAEVSARFTLDALPGKQMAIDADLNAGLIDEAQARARREAIAQEAEFYGAMDGAARFSQRDSMATILITAINIIAGFLIGVFQLGIPFQEAVKTYTVLTVGDGLVTLVPSLLVSVAGGMVVTRTGSESSLGAQLGQQLFMKPKPLWIACVVMACLGLVPGLPKIPFFAVAIGVGVLAQRRGKQETAIVEQKVAGSAEEQKKPVADSLDSLLKLDDLSLEVGYGLVALVDEKQGGQLLQRVKALRRHLAVQLGFMVPPVHITDNLKLRAREYVISLRGVEVARWEMLPDCVLAISSESDPPPIQGVETKEPAFNVVAKWISPAQQEQALALGYVVVDQTSAMATHLSEVIKQYAHELLTRGETKRLLDSLSESQPKLLEELVPKLLSLGEVQKVLQQLLREQVSVRDLTLILETLVDTAPLTKNPVFLVEAVRQAMGRSLVRPFLGEDGKLRVVALEPGMEEEMVKMFGAQAATPQIHGLQPSLLRRMVEGLKALLGEDFASATPVLLCSSPARFHLRRLLEPILPKVVVLSPGEVPSRTAIQSIGMVR
ncbi:MAG TPA: flagellar biosynthesis protein FlhA [Candidatus Angelobacter sp.]|nr:flagellar biosynthesis protein FlhA [Candidatus Angelobacter sp.]